MEMQYKEGINGEMANRGGNKVKRTDLAVRVLALVLTLAAAVVLGVNKQATTVPITIIPSQPPVNVPVNAKWHHMSAFVYFVIANAIACSYAAVSLILNFARKGGKNVSLIVTILDIVVMALLFSSLGATGAVGLIGYEGNSHVEWQKVCNVFDKFCHQVTAAMVLSLFGSMAYLLLVVFAVFNVYKKF